MGEGGAHWPVGDSQRIERPHYREIVLTALIGLEAEQHGFELVQASRRICAPCCAFQPVMVNPGKSQGPTQGGWGCIGCP